MMIPMLQHPRSSNFQFRYTISLGRREQFFECWIVILILLSRSGNSMNIIWKYEAAKEVGFFQQVSVNPGNQDVFVASQNTLYKLSGNLKVKQIQNFERILVNENECETGKDCEMENNDAEVLEVDPDGKFLLYCGALQGICGAFSVNDLNLFYGMNNKNQYDTPTSVVAVFSSGMLPNDSPVLFTASVYDQSIHRINSTHSIAAQIAQSTWSNVSSYNIKTVQNISFGEVRPGQKTFNVRYLYGFEHDQFIYFVTVQQHSDSDYETRLVRFCKSDHEFQSYTEVILSCRQKGGLRTFFNIAIAAHLAPVGVEFSRKFDLMENEMALYVVLGKSSQNSEKINEEHGYGLCLYRMEEVKNSFSTAQKDCYMGWGRILPWIDKSEPQCVKDQDQVSAIDNSFCGSRKNVGIGSRYPLSTDTNVTIRGHVPTAILVTSYQEKTVALVGTDGGYLLKFLINGSNSQPCAVLDLGSGRPVARDMTFDPPKQHVYVLTGARISMVPIESCSIYTDCEQCVTTHDPLGCGWCSDHCTTQAKCHIPPWFNNTCPPILESFSPRSGPVQGGTRLTIFGHNFGHGERIPISTSSSLTVLVAVLVAGTGCAVEFRNASCIICQTGMSVHGPIERDVKVTIKDTSRNSAAYEIRGSSSSGRLTFAYTVPVLSSFSPARGPISGGTLLTILGSSLDTGSMLNVLVAYQPCYVDKVTSTEIVCRTSAFNSNSWHIPERIDPATSGPVNLTIDTMPLSCRDAVYMYKDDPVVVSLFPRSSILSGGIPITVGGMNLNVIQLPKIIIQAEGLSFTENCTASSDGQTMVCPSPNLTSDAIGHLSPGQRLYVQVRFIMDAVQHVFNASSNLSDFTYVVDPKVTVFSGADHVRILYSDENYLEIQGQFLDVMATSSDYRVTVGDSECHITQLTSNLLLCQPDKASLLIVMDSVKEVKVFVGRLVLHVGFLQFSGRNRDPFLVLAAAPIMGSSALVIIILVLFWMTKLWQNWRKKWHSNFIASFPPPRSLNDLEISTFLPEVRSDDQRNPYLLGCSHHLNPVDCAPPDESLGATSWLSVGDLDMLIARDRLTLQEIIGQGHFGCVYRGTLQSADAKSEVKVAIKTLKTTQDDMAANNAEARKFFEEAMRMSDFNHSRILRLIGVSQDDDELPLVILPFMQHGDLLSYIRHEDNNPTVRQLMEFGIQVAEGMSYLSSLKYVHRDLAARNCMLDDNMQVKVADFGLSRDVYERDYYSCDNRQCKLPVKWMALESLEKGIYNTKTDVWSYGIVLWELLTRGVSPYPEVDNWDVIRFLKSGRRMSQPAFAPDDLYSLMLVCWHPVPNVRPTFDELIVEIQGIIHSLEHSHRKVELDASYMNSRPLDEPSYLHPRPSDSSAVQMIMPENDQMRFTGCCNTLV